MTSKKSRRHDSEFTVPENLIGDLRVYGTFEEQRILGYPCTITVSEVSDNNPAVRDMVGQPFVMRGDTAIHISGMDPFGEKTGPGFIRAIGIMNVEFHQPSVKENPPAGFGCRGPEVGMIVSWDSDETGIGHRSDIWQHHAFMSRVDSFVTLRGLRSWYMQQSKIYGHGFSVKDVCHWIDDFHKLDGCMRTSGDKRNERAIRRLLETKIDVQNVKLGGMMLFRGSRWSYYFA